MEHDLESAARRNLAWLLSLQTELSQFDPSTAMRLFVLTVLCADVICEQKYIRQAVEQTAHLCATLSLDDLISSRSELVLLCCIAQKRQFGNLLPHFQMFFDEVTNVLGEMPESNKGPYFASYLLLEQLGRHRTQRAQCQWFQPELGSLLMGSAVTVRQVMRGIESGTHFGTHDCTAIVGTGSVLAALMMSAFRRYDLCTGSALLRGLCYLNVPDDLAVRSARQFLFENQNEAGGFGFFSEKFGHPAQVQSIPVDVVLDVSFQCLWALVESGTSRYRLYRDIGLRASRLEQ